VDANAYGSKLPLLSCNSTTFARASIATHASASSPLHPQMSPAFSHYRAGHLNVMALITD
jgi:hypothetical protein